MSGQPAEFWRTLPLGPGVAELTHDVNGLVAFAKPAGILSHPNEGPDQARSLLTCAYDQQEECYKWSGGGRLWLLNRLDGATSGVILLAADAELARAIREQFARKRVHKAYEALVFGKPPGRSQVWRDLLAVQKQGGRIRTTAGAGNIPAETRMRFVAHRQGAFSTSLVRLEPRTGRSHQLRVQCARRGLPIVGDQTYGDFALNRAFARSTEEKRLFLHSLETAFDYEFRGRKFSFKAAAPRPEEFTRKY